MEKTLYNNLKREEIKLSEKYLEVASKGLAIPIREKEFHYWNYHQHLNKILSSGYNIDELLFDRMFELRKFTMRNDLNATSQ